MGDNHRDIPERLEERRACSQVVVVRLLVKASFPLSRLGAAAVKRGAQQPISVDVIYVHTSVMTRGWPLPVETLWICQCCYLTIRSLPKPIVLSKYCSDTASVSSDE